MMIRHIIFWKFNDSVKEEQKDEIIAEIKASSDNMVKNIDGLISAEIGKNTATSEFDFVYDSTVENSEKLAAYQIHPLHLEHKKRFAQYLTKPTVADYEK